MENIVLSFQLCKRFTAYKVTIDVGNSHVLYTSEDQQIGSFSHTMSGPFGHGGFGGRDFGIVVLN
jgi:hypothetical protein